MLEIDGFFVKINFARDIIGSIVEHCKDKFNPEKEGGVFVILDSKTGVLVFACLVGKASPEKAKKYFEVALEKANRVFVEKLQTSADSRDPDNGKWGGAIRGKVFIYSFSGLTEAQDEVCSIAACMDLNDELPYILLSLESRIINNQTGEDVFEIISDLKSNSREDLIIFSHNFFILKDRAK